MRLIIICFLSLMISSCSTLANFNKDKEVPKGKALLLLNNSSLTEVFMVDITASGNKVLMQFDKLDGKAVGSFFDEVFDLTVEPGKHTVNILCGVNGKNTSNNNSDITINAKADRKYVFSAYLENGACTIKYEEKLATAKK